MSDFGIQDVQAAHLQKLQQQLLQLERRVLSQVVSQKDFQMWCESGEFSGIRRNFKDLKKLKQVIQDKKKIAKQLKKLEKKEEIASKFQKKNQEFEKNDLLLLRNSINEKDTFETILKKVFSLYPDHLLCNDALEFLLQTTSGVLKENVLKAQKELLLRHEREVKAGKNILEESRIYAKKGLGTPSNLRALYYDITGNIRPVQMLFTQLTEKFTFEQMLFVIRYLFHSLGKDVKAKGPSISRAELIKLMSDTRSLQAILGLYIFFKSRMPLVHQLFHKKNIPFPKELNFKTLTKQFMKLLSLRYLSNEVIYSLSRELNLSEHKIAQIIIFTQMRDATRHSSDKLYADPKKRQEILEALIEALEELEEEEEEP